MNKLKAKAKKIKSELAALYLAYKRPDVPWYAKVILRAARKLGEENWRRAVFVGPDREQIEIRG